MQIMKETILLDALFIHHPDEKEWIGELVEKAIEGENSSEVISFNDPRLRDFSISATAIFVVFRYYDRWAKAFAVKFWKNLNSEVKGLERKTIYLWGDSIQDFNIKETSPCPTIEFIALNKDEARERFIIQIDACFEPKKLPLICPFVGLKPYTTKEQYLFSGRESEISEALMQWNKNKFLIVFGDRCVGKTSFCNAGLIPELISGITENVEGGDYHILEHSLPNAILINWRQTKENIGFFEDWIDQINFSLGLNLPLISDEWDSTDNRHNFFRQIEHVLQNSKPNYLIEDRALLKKNANAKGKNQQHSLVSMLIFYIDDVEKIVVTEEGRLIWEILIEINRFAIENELPIFILTTCQSRYISLINRLDRNGKWLNHFSFFLSNINTHTAAQIMLRKLNLVQQSIDEHFYQSLISEFFESDASEIHKITNQNHEISNNHTQMYDMACFQLVFFQIWKSATNRPGFKTAKIPTINFEDYYAIDEDLAMNNSSQMENNAGEKGQNDGLPEIHLDLKEEKLVLTDPPRISKLINRFSEEIYQKAVYSEVNIGSKEKKIAVRKEELIKNTFLLLSRPAKQMTHVEHLDESMTEQLSKSVKESVAAYEILQMTGPKAEITQLNEALLPFRKADPAIIHPLIGAGTALLIMDPFTEVSCPSLGIIRHWSRLQNWIARETEDCHIYQDLQLQLIRWLEHKCDASFGLNSSLFHYFKNWYEQKSPSEHWLQFNISEDLKRELSILANEIKNKAPENSKYDFISFYQPPYECFQSQKIVNITPLIRKFFNQSSRRNNRSSYILVFGVSAIVVLIFASGWQYYSLRESKAKAIEATNRLATVHKELADKGKEDKERLSKKIEADSIRADNERLNLKQKALAEKMLQDKLQGKISDAKKDAEIQKLKISQLDNERRLKELEKEELIKSKLSIEEKVLREVNAKQELQREAEKTRTQRDEALKNQSLYVAAEVVRLLNKNENPELAMLMALEALPTDINKPNRPYVPDAEAALYEAADAYSNKNPMLKLANHKNKITDHTFNSNGSRLISTSWDQYAKVWDARRGYLLADLKHSNIVRGAQFSRDEQIILTYSDEFSAKIWSARTFKLLFNLSGHKDLVTYASLNFQGNNAISLSLDKTARIYESYTGKLICELRGHTQKINCCEFSPDGKKVFTGSEDGTIRVWDAHSGKTLFISMGHTAPVTSLAVSFDGMWIASASKDKTVKLWNSSGTLIHTYSGHTEKVNHVTFDKSNQRILSSSSDKSAILWSVANKKLLHKFNNTAEVIHSTFTEDDKRILTTSKNQINTLWDASSFLTLTRFYSGASGNYHPCFSPDSRKIALANLHSEIEIYRILPEGQELIDYCTKILKKRELTTEERNKYLKSTK